MTAPTPQAPTARPLPVWLVSTVVVVVSVVIIGAIAVTRELQKQTFWLLLVVFVVCVFVAWRWIRKRRAARADRHARNPVAARAYRARRAAKGGGILKRAKATMGIGGRRRGSGTSHLVPQRRKPTSAGSSRKGKTGTAAKASGTRAASRKGATSGTAGRGSSRPGRSGSRHGTSTPSRAGRGSSRPAKLSRAERRAEKRELRGHKKKRNPISRFLGKKRRRRIRKGIWRGTKAGLWGMWVGVYYSGWAVGWALGKTPLLKHVWNSAAALRARQRIARGAGWLHWFLFTSGGRRRFLRSLRRLTALAGSVRARSVKRVRRKLKTMRITGDGAGAWRAWILSRILGRLVTPATADPFADTPAPEPGTGVVLEPDELIPASRTRRGHHHYRRNDMLPQVQNVVDALEELKGVTPEAILEFAQLLIDMDSLMETLGETVTSIGAMAREDLSVDEVMEDDMTDLGTALAAVGDDFGGLSDTFESVHKEKLEFLREDPNAIKWSPQANADRM